MQVRNRGPLASSLPSGGFPASILAKFPASPPSILFSLAELFTAIQHPMMCRTQATLTASGEEKILVSCLPVSGLV